MNIRIQDFSLPDFQPERYLLDEPLRNAVEIAIALEQPLLLTGEPGTGKTRLAYKVAHELAQAGGAYRFSPIPLVFNTKTSSAAKDLFYTYDALAHFQAANIKRDAGEAAPTTADFIELQALGKAIALTNPAGIDRGRLPVDLGGEARSSVVLIDEIDKAPRDFPNDILNEIEQYVFSIRELDNYSLRRDPAQRVVVIMTSNSEKNLPEPFLRRCIFYHIPFPDTEQLMAIARTQLGESTRYTESLLRELIEKFRTVRERAVRKPPATAELIAWLRMLEMRDIFAHNGPAQTEQLRRHLAVLVKTKEDMEAVRELF